MLTHSLVIAAVASWAALGVGVSVTDLRSGLIPRRAVWSAGLVIAVLLAAAASTAGDLVRFVWAVAAAGSLAVFFEVIYRVWPSRIGYGDVRLIIVNGLLAGWWGLQWSWWALAAGAVAAWPAAAVSFARRGRAATVRWAPGLVVGTAAVVALQTWRSGIA